MIRKYKLLMFIVFLESLISFSSATIVYVAVDPSADRTNGLNICKFDDKTGVMKNCISPERFKQENISGIGVSPVTHNVYFTFSGTNVLDTCATNNANGDIKECSSIVIGERGGSLGAMAFSSDGKLLYLIDREKNNIRVCHLDIVGIPKDGCPLMSNTDESPDTQFIRPFGLALTPDNSKLLVADAKRKAMLSCNLVEGIHLGNCTPMKNKNYKSPRDVAVNQHLPNHVFIAAGLTNKPVVVCNTPDYVKLPDCFAYPFEHEENYIEGITAITISANGQNAFVANESTVFTKHIKDGAQLINAKGANFRGKVNAIAAYN